jgi:glycosyltransferase involved in cell wall biosynthesis
VNKNRILVIGQTPPPIGGQAKMIERLMSGNYANAELVLNRANFSKELNETGKTQIRKIVHLFVIIFKSVFHRIVNNTKFMIYHPGGPKKESLIKDILILLSLRLFFKKVILYFHAGGVSHLYPKLNIIMQFFFRLSFFGNDYGIKIIDRSPKDPEFIRSKKIKVIHIGVPDEYKAINNINIKKLNDPINILFVGSVYSIKGVDELISASIHLAKEGISFKLNLVGNIESEEYLKSINNKIKENNLDKIITYHGLISEAEKNKMFYNADIFTFPSYFHSENSPLSIIEAISFKLPIVATNWRGIPSIVKNNHNGYLVEPKNYIELAKKIKKLIINKELREKMGYNSRKIYLEQFSMENYYQSHDLLFKEIVS